MLNVRSRNALMIWGCLSLTFIINGQVSLDELIEQGMTKAPLAQLKDLTQLQSARTKENLRTKLLPQASLSGQATYQSDVTEVGVMLPGVDIEPLSLDQYRIVGEVNQRLYDGGLLKEQIKAESIKSDMEMLQVDLDLEQTRLQIIDRYFTILLLDEKTKILSSKQQILSANLQTAQSAERHGAILSADVKVLEAAILQIDQEKLSLASKRQAQVSALQILTQSPMDSATEFSLPAPLRPDVSVNDQGYAQQLFEKQKLAIDQADEMNEATTRPQLSLFAQGGYGKPGLNFLRNEFDTYYVVGARAQWNLGKLYTRSNEREITRALKEKISVQESNYLDRVATQVTAFEAQHQEMDDQLVIDQQLEKLYSDIRKSAEVQYKNGALKSADLIEKINDEHAAKIQKELHEISQRQTQYHLHHITGQYLTN